GAGRLTKTGAGSDGSITPTESFYDGATGLMTKVSYAPGGSDNEALYSYNGDGRLTEIEDWLTTDGNGLRYAYDAAGRLTTLTDYDDSTLSYVYDAAGNVLTLTDYHGNSTYYTYTADNRVSTVTAPGSK